MFSWMMVLKPAWEMIQDLEMAIAIGGFSADKIGVEISCFNGGIRYAAAFFVEDIALDATGGELCLSKS
jgi:hypothetical protein